MTHFRDIHPDFAQLEQAYNKVIEPRLLAQEQKRLKVLAAQKKWRLILWPILLGIGLVLLLSISFMFAAFTVFIIGGIGEALARYKVQQFVTKVQEDILPMIANGLGLTLQHRQFTPPDFDLYEKYRFIPRHDRRKFQDLLQGTRQGLNFSLYESHLEQRVTDHKGRVRWQTVFHGTMVAIDYPRDFFGKTLLIRDKKILRGAFRPGKGFKRIELSSPRFEKIFDCWTTDQTEAHYLMDPLIVERFIELERLYKSKGLVAGYIDGRLYLTIKTGDILSIGKLNKSLNDRARIENLLKEFAAFYDLMDILIKPTQGTLQGSFSVDNIRHQDV